MASTRIGVEFVVARLEEAGATEMLLCGRGTRPGGFRCGMPEPVRAWEDLRYAEPRRTRPVPTARAITQWEEARGWISRAIPAGQEVTRRVVGYRMLVYWPGHDRAGEHVLSWRRIGLLVHLDHETAKSRWEQGVRRIVTFLSWQARPPGAGLCAVTGGQVTPGRAVARGMISRAKRDREVA